VQLDAGRERQAPPQLARRSNGIGFRQRDRARRAIADRPPDLVEGAAGLLHRLDAQKLCKVFLTVVVAAADPERHRQQAFLDVVAHRPA